MYGNTPPPPPPRVGSTDSVDTIRQQNILQHLRTVYIDFVIY